MRVLLVIISLLLLSACDSESLDTSFNEKKFNNSKFDYFLAFDLASDSKPKAALIIKNSLPEGHYTANLNIKSIKTKLNESLFSVVGEYENHLLVDFDISKSAPKMSAISFIPVLKDVNDSVLKDYGYKDNVYLLKRGLERTFVYNYNIALNDDLLNAKRSLQKIEPQSISVYLPEGARGIEIGRSRKTSSPEPIYIKDELYFYPYSAPSTGEDVLEIKYILKETPMQEIVVDGLIKLILVLIPSGLALLLIQSGDILNPSLRKYGLYACGLLGLLSIGGLIVYSIYFDDKAIQKSWVDIVIAIIAAIFSVIVFFSKKGDTES
ncbi:hypothetical protein P3438_22390 [Vibrio parahaemolyticus]|uniref:hypothetical protein n=4 Tax=Vibrio parahaemolyticus TaxID=670 RepID=UPI0012F8E1EF|nr:hypothetical protein [Vibrio parahaemolyticus]EJC6860267.1 hypothetical protein [Vibrio parahaemolyticus]EKN4584182.1 hypothetical protein [Vibrio parahaemolyticus]MDF4476236.1 hypothetical protein [Vibrio parahaemolyticus]MDF4480751.1 hypothetical protein [Vibrio parahaemolyticus]MDG3409145.1 hypothetical protein [Vibrio parahaemolyticus]